MFPDATEFERLRYRQGQRLRTRDFRDQAAIDAQLRWWHNRALHNAFGIAQGLQPEPTTVDGRAAVRIAKGVAHDCLGRELVVQSDRVVRVPDAVEDLALVLRYCASPAVTRVTELVWLPTHGLTIEDGVPVCRNPFETLAAIDISKGLSDAVLSVLPSKGKYANGMLAVRGVMTRGERDRLLALALDEDRSKADDVAVYRRVVFSLFERTQIDYARPRGHLLVRPRIASGATTPGTTAWTEWRRGSGRVIGAQVEIDASAAGFTSTPCYFASLQGLSRIVGTTLSRSAFEHVDRGSSAGFVFRFWIPSLLQPLVFEKDPGGALLVLVQRLKLSVRWFAVETASASAAEDR
jgi:hypothetical protein